jgi:hypothetical protein
MVVVTELGARQADGRGNMRTCVVDVGVVESVKVSERHRCAAKNGIFEPFIHKRDYSAKTGSGQTYVGKALKKRWRFSHPKHTETKA